MRVARLRWHSTKCSPKAIGSNPAPVFYVTDLLQLIRDKQDGQGRWPLEYDYTGKTWLNCGPKKQVNKWVTLRALKVIKEMSV